LPVIPTGADAEESADLLYRNPAAGLRELLGPKVQHDCRWDYNLAEGFHADRCQLYLRRGPGQDRASG